MTARPKRWIEDGNEFTSALLANDSKLKMMRATITELTGAVSAKNLSFVLSDFGAVMAELEKWRNLAVVDWLADCSDQAAIDRLEHVSGVVQQMEAAKADLLFALASLPKMQVLSEDPSLAAYRELFQQILRDKPHSLPPHEESRIRLLQQTGGEAFYRLRNTLDAALTVDQDGIAVPLSEWRRGYAAADQDTRRQTYMGEMTACLSKRLEFAHCLNAIKGEAVSLAELRGYATVLDWMLSDSRFSRTALDSLLEGMAEASAVLRTYLAARHRRLASDGVSGMAGYDLTAPLASRPVISFQRALDVVLDAAHAFAPDLARFITSIAERGHIDAYPRCAKQSGSLSAPVEGLRWHAIFLQFDGSLNAVLNLAHELGHAWHHEHTFDLPLLVRDSPTPVCETAATFLESLVGDHLLKNAEPHERLDILDAMLAAATRNIVDIYGRFLFENRLFEARRKRSLSGEELSEMMRSAFFEAYGDVIDPDTFNHLQWMTKPHYYIPNYHYYNFPYAFGCLAAEHLSASALLEGTAFVSRYRHFLERSCEGSTREIMSRIGLDIEQAAWWKMAVNRLQRYVTLFCEATNREDNL